ncbi:hypothetical protein LFLEISCH_02615 [Listeria fleischmannii subsp. fleischmannii LU2006-1]|nr:hypothetical protein LFLEISCH_02615 [Listeria fleischmannii subsp. fleischmannii LU2006-1]
MGWLKDFFFGDFEESKEEPIQKAPVKEQPKKTEQVKLSKQTETKRPERKLNKERAVVTKMVYEYPKGNFRFPVIPDRALNNEEDLPYKPVTETKTLEVKKETTVKEKFTPTEVPSPVFAFHKRPNHFEFDLDQAQSEEKNYERISLITEEVEVKEEPKETFSNPVILEKKRRTKAS